jgi:hypothetical protein
VAVDMSTYLLQKAIYDHLNAKGRLDPPDLEPETLRARYRLGEAEIRALCDGDVGALYRLGVHPVLLNSFARARVPRDRYRAALTALERDG